MSQLLTWQGLLALILGGMYGAVFGAIPGLTATLAVALFIPFAFFLEPGVALPAIIAIASVAIYAGDVGAAIAKVPGTPASAAYVNELYRLTRKKSPLYGLGISAMGSSVGGIIGTILLILTAGIVAGIAKQFSSFEYFWLAVLGLSAGVFASQKSPLKGLVSLLIGLFFATVGIDPTLGHARFHFGIPDLLGGLNYIVAMIGLFGFSEVLEFLYRKKEETKAPDQSIQKMWHAFFLDPLKLIGRKWILVIRSSLMGMVVGFLPGAGADIGAWVASSIQKMRRRSSRTMSADTEEEVVLAGSSSNNAAVASAWIPALALGLPGDTITAMVLGVFLMKGITPGPLLFDQMPELPTTLFLTFFIANLILLPFWGYVTARMANRIIKIPLPILLSIISAICVAGAFAINRNPNDVLIMVGMGGFAFLLRRGGFPLAQVVLGMVLGPILEQQFMVSVIKSSWDWMSFFDRPVALVLMVLTLILIGVGIRFSFHNNK
ncbi:MAG: tripartite tricarboxylate transporter permease [Bacteroidota bacterium]